MTPDIQYFGSDGTWNRPERAVAVDVLVQAGGGSAAPGTDGEDGGIAVKRFHAPGIPPTMDVQIGKGGRPGGRDGYVLVLTHQAPSETRVKVWKVTRWVAMAVTMFMVLLCGACCVLEATSGVPWWQTAAACVFTLAAIAGLPVTWWWFRPPVHCPEREQRPRTAR